MKRSEVIDRLRRADPLRGPNGREVSGGLLSLLSDESLVKIAEWLGIEVEPDEPPLPDVLYHEEIGLVGDRSGWRKFCLIAPGAIAVASYEANLTSGELISRLVLEHNSRPRWRIGTPDRPGWYAVRLLGHNNTACRLWDRRDSTWTMGDGKPTVSEVVAWMPLPT